ncbi:MULTISPECIES: 2OG-Fe(II) oxygenase [Rhizobium]|jgi:hypothetical protein|uniref:2OG-Fe(II) oxygenase n=1 Tax=Rhizobium TaxID=379 RepID=UPI0009E81A91|nr:MULTISPECIES: 2OG-Fe(II) oxygenase [Rhizobium]
MSNLQAVKKENCHDFQETDNRDYLIETNKYSLNKDHITALARSEVRVVKVKGFANGPSCDLISKGQTSLGFQPYINVSEVRKIGMAFYETEMKQELIDKYFTVASDHQNDFRKACEPFGSPLDTLRALLDEIWPAGANLQTIFGRKMFVGLSRMVEPDTTFLAHHDIFSEDAPGIEEAESLTAQFAANIYFQVPDIGGELLMWHKNMTTQEFNERRKGKYGIAIEDLPPPDVVIKPGRGDLLIFDSRKIHAVASPRGSSRMAVSFFIGYRGEECPLTYWS